MTTVSYYFNSRDDQSGPWVRAVFENTDHLPVVGDLLYADSTMGYPMLHGEVKRVFSSIDGQSLAVIVESALSGQQLLNVVKKQDALTSGGRVDDLRATSQLTPGVFDAFGL